MRPRLFVLLLAALVITALCAWKTSRPPSASSLRGELPELRQPAPAFALYTHHSPPQIVRLATYLGRHSILVVFFDGREGASATTLHD